MEIAQVLRAWKGIMRLFPRERRWERGGRPTPLNPAEQVFAEVQQCVEGRQYERIEAKQAAVEAVPRRLEAEAKVSSLGGRRHIRQALNALRSCAFRNGIREASTRKLLWGQGRDSEEGSEFVSRLSLSFTRRKGDTLPSQKFRRPI